MIQHEFLISIGILLIGGLLADLVARATRVPRVTLLLALGIIVSAFGLVPPQIAESADSMTAVALTLVAFLLGGAFKWDRLKTDGIAILCISFSIIIATLLIVTIGLTSVGVEVFLALLLASIATATAPAATLDVIRQSGISNRFSRIVTGVVAVDDALGLLTFSICLSVAIQFSGASDSSAFSVLLEIAGAICLGFVVGLPAAFLTGRIGKGEPLLIEALAVGFLIAGLCAYFDYSFLISGMVAGALVANLAQHHQRAFDEVEHIQWPFMVIFFILAGAALKIDSIATLGFIGFMFVLLRIIGRLLGGWIGATIAGTPRPQRVLFGFALLPQAGVAIGMALFAGQALPKWSDQIMTLVIGTTVLFEIIGPIFTMWALKKSRSPEIR